MNTTSNYKHLPANNFINRRQFFYKSGCAIFALSTPKLFLKEALYKKDNYLKIVCDYADCLIKYGRDRYGSEHSPLFAEGLDRNTLKLLEGENLKKVQELKFEEWGIRSYDRMLEGANPMHSQNLYQILYALATITKKKSYISEADQSLKFFLNKCQNSVTGLFYWGEHAGWDFREDAPISGYVNSNVHEFYRPWVLWKKCWELAPDACLNFARGLWDHQIADHKNVDFSRHARIDRHGPGTGAPYARHGGFYIETWAFAYKMTNDKIFLIAIEALADYLENMRLNEGMIAGGNIKTRASYIKRSTGLAISLWNASEYLPEYLSLKLKKIASFNDIPASEKIIHADPSENIWSDGYGGSGGETASSANLLMLRYRQCQPEGYRERILAGAKDYINNQVNLSFPVYPGTFGKVIFLMLNAYELSADPDYLRRADELAKEAVKLFLPDNCPLPKATHKHGHYEGVTMADTLMMSLLQLWAVQQKAQKQLTLVYSDR